jgi:hypothetical protein
VQYTTAIFLYIPEVNHDGWELDNSWLCSKLWDIHCSQYQWNLQDVLTPLRRGTYSNRKDILLQFWEHTCCPSEVKFRQSIYLVAYWDFIYVWKKLQPWYNRMTSATVLEIVRHFILAVVVKAIQPWHMKQNNQNVMHSAFTISFVGTWKSFKKIVL